MSEPETGPGTIFSWALCALSDGSSAFSIALFSQAIGGPPLIAHGVNSHLASDYPWLTGLPALLLN